VRGRLGARGGNAQVTLSSYHQNDDDVVTIKVHYCLVLMVHRYLDPTAAENYVAMCVDRFSSFLVF
jgi:hypothetical protein